MPSLTNPMKKQLPHSPAIEATRNALLDACKAADKPLHSFPRSECGLVSEEVRLSPEYREANANYQRAFQALRRFNTLYKPCSTPRYLRK